MPKRRRRQPGRAIGPIYPDTIMMRLESCARVGFAKWYAEMAHSRELEQANGFLVERIETLIPVLLELVDDVLLERNIEAFCSAYRVRDLVRQYAEGARR